MSAMAYFSAPRLSSSLLFTFGLRWDALNAGKMKAETRHYFYTGSDMARTTTLLPQQEEAGFCNDALWRKMLIRAQKGTTHHAFFAVEVAEGCLHTTLFCRIVLPTPFMQHHCQSLNEHIILEGPDGHQWPTMLILQLDSHQPCLRDGWKEFAADYNLAIKDQVVFFLFDHCHFLVQVYDANNNVKHRVSASPEKVAMVNTDMNVKIVSPVAIPAQISEFRTPTQENVIHILDSSDEEENGQASLKDRRRDASKMGGSNSSMTLRSARKPEKVDTQGHTVKSSAVCENEQAQQKHGQSEDNETGTSVDRVLGENNNNNNTPDCATTTSAPSSPEQVMVLKRSRRLQRISGDYEGDGLGRATSVVKRFKLFEPGEVTPSQMYDDAKELAVATKAGVVRQVPGSDMLTSLTSCCSTQQSTMKQGRLNPQPCLSQEEEVIPEYKQLTRLGAQVKPSSLLYVSRRRPVTAQEKQVALEAARAYASKSSTNHCVMQLRNTQAYGGFHLGVQTDFVEAMQLPFTRMKVMLSDRSGKAWEVEWMGDHPKHPGLHGAGWTKFAVEHYLEEGDVCVFQKSKVAHNTIYVEIFPVVPLVALPGLGWRSHYDFSAIAGTAACQELPDQSQC